MRCCQRDWTCFCRQGRCTDCTGAVPGGVSGVQQCKAYSADWGGREGLLWLTWSVQPPAGAHVPCMVPAFCHALHSKSLQQESRAWIAAALQAASLSGLNKLLGCLAMCLARLTNRMKLHAHMGGQTHVDDMPAGPGLLLAIGACSALAHVCLRSVYKCSVCLQWVSSAHWCSFCGAQKSVVDSIVGVPVAGVRAGLEQYGTACQVVITCSHSHSMHLSGPSHHAWTSASCLPSQPVRRMRVLGDSTPSLTGPPSCGHLGHHRAVCQTCITRIPYEWCMRAVCPLMCSITAAICS